MIFKNFLSPSKTLSWLMISLKKKKSILHQVFAESTRFSVKLYFAIFLPHFLWCTLKRQVHRDRRRAATALRLQPIQRAPRWVPKPRQTSNHEQQHLHPRLELHQRLRALQARTRAALKRMTGQFQRDLFDVESASATLLRNVSRSIKSSVKRTKPRSERSTTRPRNESKWVFISISLTSF